MTDSVEDLLGMTQELTNIENTVEENLPSQDPGLTPVVVDENLPPADLGMAITIIEPELPVTETELVSTEPVNQPDLLDQIMGRIKPPSVTNQYLRMLIYGDPGVRKTTYLTSAPGVLIYECDTGGSESLLNFPETANTPVLPFKSTFQLNGLLDAMLNDDPRLSHIHTFAIDTYTMYQARDLAEIPRTGDGKPNYMLNTENLKTLTDKLRQIPKHLILTAHVKEEKDQTTGIILRRPELTPKVSQAVIAMMGIIGYMTLDGDNWQLQLQPSPGVAAKCRVGGLPATLSNPSFETILAARNATIKANASINGEI